MTGSGRPADAETGSGRHGSLEDLRSRLWELLAERQRNQRVLEAHREYQARLAEGYVLVREQDLERDRQATARLLDDAERRVQDLVAEVSHLDTHLRYAAELNAELHRSTSMRVGLALRRLRAPLRRLAPARRATPRQLPPPDWDGRQLTTGSASDVAHEQVAPAQLPSSVPNQVEVEAPPARPQVVPIPWQDGIVALRDARRIGVDAVDSILELKRAMGPATDWNPRERQAVLEAESAAMMHCQSGRHRRPRAGSLTVVDARCLADLRFRDRGVGRHAQLVLEVISGLVGPEHVVALVDDAALLTKQTRALVGSVVRRPHDVALDTVRAFVQLSPMTASVSRIAPFLGVPGIGTLTVVYDFIPSELPEIYLTDPVDSLEFESRLLALAAYDASLPISQATADALKAQVRWGSKPLAVTGVADTLGSGASDRTPSSPFVLAPTGDDVRKDLLVALRAFATFARKRPHTLVVVGLTSGSVRARWRETAVSLGLDEDRVDFLPHVADGDLSELYRRAAAVLVPSRREGFSMPVAEAVGRGCPVVASAIAEHEELIGTGWWLVPVGDDAAFSAALSRAVDNRSSTVTAQASRLGDIAAGPAVAARVLGLCSRVLSAGKTVTEPAPRRRSVAVLSPLPPQKSGIADYTVATMGELGKLVDVTVFSEADPVASYEHFDVRPLTCEPYVSGEFDSVISVVGNSDLHVETLEYLEEFGGPCLAHDNRMIELYNWWYGPTQAGLVLDPSGAIGPEQLTASLHDLDSAPNLGFGPIADAASPLIVHANDLARRLRVETGREVRCVPFVPYALGASASERASRVQARRLIGLTDDRIHVVTFGEVDVRTKGADLLVAATAWLRQWGLPVHLHFVGFGVPALQSALQALADDIGVPDALTFHGPVGTRAWDHFLAGADLAVQLRTSALLSLSGALADCVGAGLPTLTTAPLAAEMGVPRSVARVPSWAGPFLIAEALEQLYQDSRDPSFASSGSDRLEYLASRSAPAYAQGLLAALEADA